LAEDLLLVGRGVEKIFVERYERIGQPDDLKPVAIAHQPT